MIFFQPINIQNNIKQRPSFKGQRLFPVPLLKIIDNKTQLKIPAYFTKIDSSDKSLMMEVCDVWEPSCYGEMICKGYFRKEHGYSFAQDYEYFMIETDAAINKEKSVKAIAEVIPENHKIEINFLQSRSEFETKETIKGGATMLLYGLCEYAKQIKAKGIELFSDNERSDKLYKELGFDEITESLFVLPAKNYNKFIKNIKEKFF